MKHITQAVICQLANHGFTASGLSGRSFMRRPVDAGRDSRHTAQRVRQCSKDLQAGKMRE